MADAGFGVPIDFVPSVVYATRFPNTCGVANPPFKNGDLFSLEVVGARTAAPYNALNLSFQSPAPAAGTSIALAPLPFKAQGTGIDSQPPGMTTWYPAQGASGGGVNFTFLQGSDPNEIDPGAFDSVVVTLTQLPTSDGAPFAARLQIHFVDGKQLDASFSNALTTSVSGCPRP
jgi:hypothetical protein